MWYIFGTRWRRDRRGGTPERTYKIGHAVSRDGVSWSREEARQIVDDRLGPDESQALPTVVRIGARYHMFFCYRQSSDFRTNRDRGYRIGHAWSDDLVRWTRDDDGVGIEGTPGELGLGHAVLPQRLRTRGSHVYMLYNGNEFGRHGFGLAIAGVMMAGVAFEMNTASEAQIVDHLARCDADFVPPLASRVDIAAYAQKIVDRATRFEAWDGTSCRVAGRVLQRS